MSAEGGAAVVGLGVLVAAPFVVAAVVAAGIVGGTGLLLYEGGVYCGKKLQQNYQNACDSWKTIEQQAQDEAHQQHVESQRAFMEQALAQLAVAQSYLPPERRVQPVDAQAKARQEAELQQAIQQATAAAQSSGEGTKALIMRAKLSSREAQLHNEIAAAQQAALDANVIAQVESVLVQVKAAISQPLTLGEAAEQLAADALNKLNAAWVNITETEKVRTRNADAAARVLAQIEAQLNAANMLLASGQHQALQKQLDEIAATAGTARNRLEADPQRALEDARAAHTTLDSLMNSVYSANAEADAQMIAERVALQGQIEALQKLIREARLSRAFAETNQDASTFATFEKTAQSLQSQIQGADRSTYEGLKQQVELLKTAVFDAISARQQRAVAETIVQTLGELNFHARPGSQDAPQIQEVASGVYQVVGVREDAQAGAGRDDKRVSFMLTADGNLTYDFSGYIGDACVKDAQIIFKALRAKGVVIADPDWIHTNLSTLNANTLMTAPEPQLQVNKRQTLLIDRILKALERMGYPQENILVTSIGGATQIDARNGDLGYYHVALATDGDMKTNKNQQDISNDESDTIARIAWDKNLPPISHKSMVEAEQDTEHEATYIQGQQPLQH